MKESAVVLLSGGLDSTVLLFKAKADGLAPIGLTVRYGQRHAEEAFAAHAIAHEAGVPHVVCDADQALTPIFANANSSQVGRFSDVPEGHYAAPEMVSTIVPNRNMVLLALAGALAVSRGASQVLFAAHSGDHAVYPDCKPDFVEAMKDAMWLGSQVSLWAPFSGMFKAEIVLLGSMLDVPMQLTYSCYRGNRRHCGRCSTCVERQEAFSIAAVADPTEYADSTFWRTAVEKGA